MAEETPRRVIFLLLDTLRADHLHYMGYSRETSPHLDKIAASSANFRFAIAHGDGTVYSMPSLFTGKYYTQLFGDFAPEGGVPEEHTTLAELFQGDGYLTVGWSTNPNVSKRTHYDQGFDAFHELWGKGVVYSRIEHVIRKVRRTYRPTGGKEFLYVHLMDVHSPYFPPAPYHKMWSKPYERSAFKNGRMTGVDGKESIGLDPYWAETNDVGREDIAYAMGQYDGEIRYLNAYLQDLFDALHYDPEEDFLVITADHGEQFYEHGFLGHNKSTLLSEIHVPLLIRHPDLAPQEVETPVGLSDVLPTLCEVFGFDVPSGVRGQSLAGALRGEGLAPVPIYSEGSPVRGAVGVAIADGLLYLLNAQHDLFLRPWRLWPFEQKLYDIVADPGCLDNLVATRPDAVVKMNATLRGLNPRFSYATMDRLDGDVSGVEYGVDLIDAAGGVITLGKEKASARLKVNAAKDELYVLSFTYSLTGGELGVATEGGEGRRPYAYTFYKETELPRAFQVVMRPKHDVSSVMFRVTAGGEARVSNVRLRGLGVPSIPLGQFDDAGGALEQERELNEEELERLEALGYVF